MVGSEAAEQADPEYLVESGARVVRGLVLGLLLLASTGCFQYVSVPIESVSIGEGVRLVVTREGGAEYRDVTGSTDNVPTVTGTLTGRDDDVLVLQVPVGARQEGFYQVGIDATVRVPVGEVLDAGRREINPFTTGALVVGAAGLGVLVFRQIITAINDGSSKPGGDIEESILRTPLLRIPFGR